MASLVALRLPSSGIYAFCVLCQLSCVLGFAVSKLADQPCWGGEHKCLRNGTCTASENPVEGVACGGGEYLLCEEHTSITLEACEAACCNDAQCKGFMFAQNAENGKGRCEIHTHDFFFTSEPVECYIKQEGAYNLAAKDQCRTKAVTGFHEKVAAPHTRFWESRNECEKFCASQNCTGYSWSPVGTSRNLHECRIHNEPILTTDIFALSCWTLVSRNAGERCTKLGNFLAPVSSIPAVETTNMANSTHQDPKYQDPKYLVETRKEDWLPLIPILMSLCFGLAVGTVVSTTACWYCRSKDEARSKLVGATPKMIDSSTLKIVAIGSAHETQPEDADQ